MFEYQFIYKKTNCMENACDRSYCVHSVKTRKKKKTLKIRSLIKKNSKTLSVVIR